VGVTYGVHPMDQRLRAGLPEYGLADVQYPDGRNPRLTEIHRVLEELSGFKAEYDPAPAKGHSWGVTIEDAVQPEKGPWAHLRTLHYSSEDEFIEIYFEKGWPDLIVRIVAALAAICGTLCIVPDTGDAPLVIPAGADAEALLRTWEHTRPMSDGDVGDKE